MACCVLALGMLQRLAGVLRVGRRGTAGRGRGFGNVNLFCGEMAALHQRKFLQREKMLSFHFWVHRAMGSPKSDPEKAPLRVCVRVEGGCG